MSRSRSAHDLSVEDLRYLILKKRRLERKVRLEHFSRTGSLTYDRSESAHSGEPAESGRSLVADTDLKDYEIYRAGAPEKQHRGLDRLLFLVEALAVLGLVFVLMNGVSLVRNLNREVVSALEQPTLTPTPLIMAVILPSGHTPPNVPGGGRPNEAEIPEHLRPLVQSIADLPVPTPGPQQAMRIQIPAISIDYPVVQGDGWEQLKKGVGQRIGTPNPSEDGNIILSAHNDIFGEIFRDLDKLQVGDTVTLFTSQRTYTYVVINTLIVEPTQTEVMAPTQEPVVTLISCYPYMVDNKRIVVIANLQE